MIVNKKQDQVVLKKLEVYTNILVTVDFNSHQIKDQFAKVKEECMALLLVISI
jgi:hypothetical protein